MEWLNYHHLLYFRLVAHEGSVTAAARKLRLAQSTVSAQLQQLEASLGVPLLVREGRALRVTDEGRRVLRYADEIFALGREVLEDVRGREGALRRLVVGSTDVLPKLVVHRLLEPALRGASPPSLVCVEGSAEALLQRLLTHDLDLVLTDSPASVNSAFNHLLGESPVSLFAAPALARSLRVGFPSSLQGAAFLLPAPRTALRRSLSDWFDAHGVKPRVVAEFDDSALLKAFAAAGHGVFAAPAVIAPELRRQYGVRLVGVASGLQERFYAVSAERRLSHPTILALVEAARRLFKVGHDNHRKNR